MSQVVQNQEAEKKTQETQLIVASPTPKQVEMREKAKKYHGELSQAKETIAELQKRVAHLEEHVHEKTTAIPEPSSKSAQASTQEPTHREPEPDEPLPVHFVKSWSRSCPTCGKENPTFKDETQCQDCNAHLGSAEGAKKLSSCPYCGSQKLLKDLRK